ncbi:MAG: D-Ala-D-Ala carboxypeptidase family metallohydrolase [Pseudomonadota bacterium]
MPNIIDDLLARPYSWSDLPPMSDSDFHSANGEIEWRFDESGLYTRRAGLTEGPLRTRGEPVTVLEALRLYGDAIHAFSLRYRVPAELILMTIGTEAAHARADAFTGPRTFRWERHVRVTDVHPPDRGDYSAGPMQTLATTARWVAGKQAALSYEPFAAASHFRDEPATSPARTPLYNPVLNIDIGCAEIVERWRKSADDPILVAACYNAGGLYESDRNRWGLRSHGNHLDRAAAYYGDACAVLSELRGGSRRIIAPVFAGPRAETDIAPGVAPASEAELRAALPFSEAQITGTEGDESGVVPDGASAAISAAEEVRDAPSEQTLEILRAALPPAIAAADAGDYLRRFTNFVDDLGIEFFSAPELLYMGASNAPGGRCDGLNALPSEALWPRVAKTALMIDEIRRQHGAPIVILSGYRSEDYNACVKGKPNSLHRVFNALDFTSRSGSPARWAAIAANLRATDSRFRGGIGVYHGRNFVHVDTRGYNADWTG